MAHLRKLNYDLAGYDEGRSLQILPRNKNTTFYLVAGEGLTVGVDDDSVCTASSGASDDKAAHKTANLALSNWEKGQVIRKITVKAQKTGETVLRAKNGSSDWIAPLSIRVIDDPDARQVGKALGQVTPELRKELQKLSMREAVMRVAEDQMRSAISTNTSGFGVYNIDKELNWCGAFAYWCWSQAAAIRGVANPLGGNNDVLFSPQKAISWAMRPDSNGQVLRYAGGDPMGASKTKQEYREIGYNGYTLAKGDIVLLRDGLGPNDWKHVCMVWSVSGSTVKSLDGNQGSPSIKFVERSMTAMVGAKAPALVFVKVLVP